MTCPVAKNLVLKATHILNKGQPLLMLAARLLMARVFFISGMLKISNWPNTIDLFTNEFPVPFLPPEFAALSGTLFELSCPVLLVLGLGARFATLPLLAMTAVINFTYQDAIEHYYWATILGLILCYGAGPLSLDALIRRKCNQQGA